MMLFRIKKKKQQTNKQKKPMYTIMRVRLGISFSNTSSKTNCRNKKYKLQILTIKKCTFGVDTYFHSGSIDCIRELKDGDVITVRPWNNMQIDAWSCLTIVKLK
jgi:hypothetical protein